MRLYHFLDRKWGLDDIRNRRLKIARLNQLNDPFEMLSIRTDDSELRHFLEKSKTIMSRSKGILCFSRNWHNPVQWAHYSEKHQGICLGFDVPDEVAVSVRYSAKRLEDDGSIRTGGERALEFMERLLTTKYSHWRYEKEVRCFMDIGHENLNEPIWYEPFAPHFQLREVIVGLASSITRSEINAALGELTKTVKIRKARRAFRTFSVVEQRLTSAWS